MRTILSTSAVFAIVALAGTAIAQEEPLEFDLEPSDDVAATVGVADAIDASTLMRDSEVATALEAAMVTDASGVVIGEVAASAYGDDGRLESLVVEAVDGASYDLPAQYATLDASTNVLTSAATLAELDVHRNPLEKIGDSIADVFSRNERLANFRENPPPDQMDDGDDAQSRHEPGS